MVMGNIPGSDVRNRVEPMIGFMTVEGSDNPDYMSDLNTLLLMMGQLGYRTDRNLFVKYLNKIEVHCGTASNGILPKLIPTAE